MATVRATREATEEELATLVRRRLDSFVAHGTTTLEIKGGYGLTLEDEAKMLAAAKTPHPANRVYTAARRPLPARPSTRGATTSSSTTSAPRSRRRWPAQAEFVDVFCDEGAFTVAQARRVLEAGTAPTATASRSTPRSWRTAAAPRWPRSSAPSRPTT